MSQALSIVIVGGGFSGAVLAAHLLRRGPGHLTVHVVEPRQRLGQGIAYGDASAFHILNVTADKMSLWADEPMSFLEWAQAYGPKLGWPHCASARPHSYLPRQLFGHYVEAELKRMTGPDRPSLHHHQAVAQNLVQQQGKFRVGLDNGGTIDADQVILATGFRAPSIPFPVSGHGPRFIADPWAHGALDAIKPHDAVLLIGTGLTMVDMVFSLDRAKHQGLVTAVSRHGFLPRIHDHSETCPPILTAQDSARGVVHCLTKFRRVLAAGQTDWRIAVDALRPIIDELWQALPPSEQRRFLRHLRPLWEVHRHRMPAQSAELLLKRIAQGRLQVEAARVKSLRIEADLVHADLIVHGSATTRSFAWVVNCTPPAPPLAPGGDELTQSLLRAKLVREHRTGLGYDVDPGGRAVNADGQSIPNLYVLGPSRRGHSIEATAVPHIRLQLAPLLWILLKDYGQTSA